MATKKVLSSQTPIAEFTVTILSARDATWQGVLEHKGKKQTFESELQLLQAIMDLSPELKPKVSWQ